MKNCRVDDVVGVTSRLLPTNDFNNENQSLTTVGIKSHGKITFGRLQSNKAEFIRVSSKISAVNVKEFLIRQHCNRCPSLVISITGSVEEQHLRSKLFRIFQKATRNIDTWIITDGFTTNLTKLIGEIVRTNPNPTRFIRLIGIADWRSVSSVHEFDIDDEGTSCELSANNQKDEILEPNHTDFIFIDDENQQTNDSILEFRAHFEKVLSTNVSSSFSFIPVVLLVIEGNQDIIKQVHQAIVHNNIPVVFLENSGKYCDLFAKIDHLYNEYQQNLQKSHRKRIRHDQTFQIEQNKRIKNSIRQKVQLNINDMNSISSTDILNDRSSTIDYYQLIYECIEQHQTYMNFVDLKVHSQIESNIDFAILKSILIALSANYPTITTSELKQKQIHLALDWNRVDIVKNFIMTNEDDWKSIDLNDLFIKALIRNQVTFVELFLEHDFSLEDLCRNYNTLSILYKNEIRSLKDDSSNSLRAIYTEIIRPLVGDFFDINAVLSTDNMLSSLDIPIDANKELFLWSVLTGKQAFALLFWARGKNKTCAALVATLIYKTKARKDKDIRFNEFADEFQSLAVEILEKFYRTNPSKCIKAIIRQIPEFGNMTWLHLAVIAEAKQFIAQRAVQNVLSDIWYGYIDHTVGNRMIIFSTIMFWYSGFLPYHEELVEKTEDIPQTDEWAHYSRFIQYDASRTEYIVNRILSSKRSKFTLDIEGEEGCCCLPSINRPSRKKIKNNVSRYIQNIFMFLHAPYVKYLYHMYSHVIFLLLFSYVVLCDFFPLYNFKSTKCLSGSEDHLYAELIDSDDPPTHVRSVRNRTERHLNVSTNETFEYGLQRYERPATTEILLTIWVFTLFCEEIRQIFSTELHSMYGKFMTYFSIIWNKLDVVGILLFFIAIILRYLPTNQCFCAARIILAIDLSLWYIRILDIFAAVKRLGPKLVMIGEMVHDMTFFMSILTVFILAFGVPTYSLMFGVQKFNWHLPRAILNLAYWQIFGELEVLDEIEKDYEISGYVMFILLIAYMTIASVLLINLLIAMFSNTFDRLHTDADCIWKFQHYYLVCHHLTRPCLPPPLIALSHLWRVSLYFFSHVVKIRWFADQYVRHKNQAKFKITLDERLIRDIESIEDALGNDVLYLYSKVNRKLTETRRDIFEERIHSPQETILNKVKILENRIRTMQTQQNNMFEYLECLMNGMQKLGGSNNIETPKRHYFDSD